MQRGWGGGNKPRPACWPAFRAVDLNGLTDNGLRQIFAPEPPGTAATAAVVLALRLTAAGAARCAAGAEKLNPAASRSPLLRWPRSALGWAAPT
ncbi:hypothetical protein [Photorhabdus thracensis]|uniref:hypothetical protein n=1 Tax=Photorhabdus thracensis TaxID=230089 RepID=UPI00130139DE|nr:hypothetical protein [Photorhabdus thracensis]